MAVAATGFVGRERELSELAGLLAEVAAGRGAAVLVEGEAGIGKTALLETGLGGAGEMGFTVLWGYCDELTRRLPLSAMLEALAAADKPNAGALSVPGRESALSMRMAGGDPVMAEIERLLALVDQLCAAGPVVLAIEDLHWADDATLLLWRRLSRSTAQLPLLLVGSCRPVPQPPELDRLRDDLRESGGLLIGLEGLSAADVARLARERLGFLPGTRLTEHLALASGNPLYTRELLDALVRSGEMRTLADAADLVAEEPLETVNAREIGTAVSLSRAIADRLDFLRPEVRDTLRLAALLGRVFAVDDVSLVTGLTPTALLGGLQEAIAAGVLEPDGPRLRFRHGLLRQALYESVPAPIRAALHQQVIQALTAASASAERIAELMLPVLDEATGWELDWIAANAQPLADRAPEAAVQLLEHALSQLTHGDPRRAAVADALLAVAFYLGRFDQAEQLSEEILASAPDPERTGLTVWFRARSRMGRGRQPEALEAVTTALNDHGALSPQWRALHMALRSTILVILGRADEARQDAAAALSEGERLSDRYASAYALHASALLGRTSGETLDYIGRGLDMLDGVAEGADLRLLLLGNRFGHLANSDRFAEAEQAARQALTLAEQSWTPRLSGLRLIFVDSLYQLGRWDDALAELELIAQDRGVPVQMAGLRHAYQALIAGHRDDRNEAVRQGELLAAQAGSPASNGASAVILLARLLGAERIGTPEALAAVLEDCLEAPEAVVFAQGEMLLPAMTRAARQNGDESVARAVDELRRRAAPDGGRPEALASDQWCEGLSSGDPAPIITALTYYRGSGRLPMLGNALEDAAVLQAVTGDTDAARATFGEALEVYGKLGAVWDSRRAAGRLRPFGVRPGVRGVRRRPRSGWQSLTDTELRVADLLGQGLSNPDIAVQLFLSRRTVETHVSHILAKLELRSRRDVARVVRPA